MDIKMIKAIITGGSSGIGFDTAKLLRLQGAQVVICSRKEENVLKVAKELDHVMPAEPGSCAEIPD